MKYFTSDKFVAVPFDGAIVINEPEIYVSIEEKGEKNFVIHYDADDGSNGTFMVHNHWKAVKTANQLLNYFRPKNLPIAA